MADVSIVIVGKIIEGALKNDIDKVKAYSKLAIEHLERDGDTRAARILKSKLDGTYESSLKIVLD